MTPELRPYLQYKDSGLLPFGNIPIHWDILRLRNTADMLVSTVDKHTKEDESPVRLCNYVDVYKNDRITERLKFMQATATKDEVKQFRLSKGDVLITKDSEAWNDIGVPALVEFSAPDLICGYHLAMLRPRKQIIDSSFLFRALQSRNLAYQFHIEANGVTRFGLSHDAIKSVWLPIPSIEEQQQIAKFLEQFDSRITRLIRLKRRQIALLNEQKQAIIQQAVTRGLDPDVRLKPSGVEWLGDIPEHWELRRLKTIAKIRYGLGQPPRELESGLPLIRATNIDYGRITTKDLINVDPADVPKSRNAFLSKDEIIVVRSGAYTADSAIIPGEYDGAISGYDMVVTVTKAYPQFIAMVFLSAYVRDDQLITSSMRSAQPHLNSSELGNSIILIPPYEEQFKITEFINIKFTAIDNAIDHAKGTIDTLQEYRTRLIADVVTGKLDVRGVELPEIELIEDEETFVEAGDLPEDDLEVEIDGQDGYE